MLSEHQKRLKKRMLRRIRKQIAECEQAIRDAHYWNSINPNETPLDIEPERVTIHLSRKIEKVLVANKGERLDFGDIPERIIEALKS